MWPMPTWLLLTASLLPLLASGAEPCPAGQVLSERRFKDSSQLKEQGCVQPVEGGKPLRQGRWQTCFPNGQVESEVRYVDGLQEGPWLGWFEDGTKSGESRFVHGKAQGPARTWHPNGRLAREFSFVDSEERGPSREWAPDGQLVLEVTFSADGHQSTARKWNPDGGVRWERHFKDGRLDPPLPKGADPIN
jgi:antitoxin component YwqK of YwqJK toxin-antitoxin module